MKSLIIDPRMSGIAGNMMLAALLDLTGDGECLALLNKAVCEVTHCTASIKSSQTNSMGLKAVKMDLELNDEEFASPEDLRSAFKNIANFMEISPDALEKGLEIINTITKVRNTVLHSSRKPAGNLENIIEISGIIWLLDQHGYLNGKIISMPPALGNGSVNMDSVALPSPAPAILEIITRNAIPVVESSEKTELSTLTGMALLACLADEFSPVFPTSTPVKTGYGTGGSELKRAPNVLRLIETIPSFENNTHAILLETLVEDVSGRIISQTIERLQDAGAYNCYVTPSSARKGRPASLLSVLCAPGEEKGFSLMLMQNIGSTEIYSKVVDRYLADVKVEKYKVELDGEKFPVRIEIATFDGHLISRKPNFEDLCDIAKLAGLSPRIISEEVKRQCFLPIKDTHPR